MFVGFFFLDFLFLSAHAHTFFSFLGALHKRGSSTLKTRFNISRIPLFLLMMFIFFLYEFLLFLFGGGGICF